MELKDWQSAPTHRYYVEVTRPARTVEGYRFPERVEDHTIFAATLADAERVARYHFLFSTIESIVEDDEKCFS